MARFNTLSKYFVFACILASTVSAKPKTVIYWGQESDGKEQSLSHYCASGDYDIIVMGFAYEFPTPSNSDSEYPALNFASHCETPYDAANPQLLICPSIGDDIEYCQSLGVEILMSFGGGVGRYGFSSDTQAITFATLVWNMFFEGTGAIRPFGTAIIDGVDLDIEGGGTTGYVAFINTLRSYFATSSRSYVISSAPQCVYPDGRLGPGAGTALGGAWMDYVFVQFYNNFCGLEFMPYLATPQFNFDLWANWARSGSANPNVKVFIGAPAASRAVGAGYVDSVKLQAYADTVMASYPDVYGGIMLWDASNSDNNNNFGALVSVIVKSQAGISVESSAPVIPVEAPVAPVDQSPSVGAVEPSEPLTPSTDAQVDDTSSTGVAQVDDASSSTGDVQLDDSSSTGAAQVDDASSSTGNAQVDASSSTGDAQVDTFSTGSVQVDDTPSTGVQATTPVLESPDAPATADEPQADTTAMATPESPVSAPIDPPATVIVPPVSVADPTPESSSSCVAGSMKCLTSETYSMCNRGSWDTPQSCQYGLTCSPSGIYIYCV